MMNSKGMRMMLNSGWIPGQGLGPSLQGSPNSLADTMGLNAINFQTLISQNDTRQQVASYDPPEFVSSDFSGGQYSLTPSDTLNNIQEITQNDFGLSFGDLGEVDTSGTLSGILENIPSNYSNISEVPSISAEIGSKLLTSSVPELTNTISSATLPGIGAPLMGLQIAGNLTSSALTQNAQTDAFNQHTAQLNTAHGAASTQAANFDYAQNQNLINAQSIGSSVGSLFGPLGSLAGWGIGTMIGNQSNLDNSTQSPQFSTNENIQ